MSQKVGRNDPCPCGSGKKYKKCCEQKLAKKKFEASVLHSGVKPSKATQISSSFFNRNLAQPSTQKTEELKEDLPKEEKPQHPPEADRPM